VAAVDAYDSIAPHYKPYSQSRSSYLRKVEDIVISQTGPAASLLDVGAGNGSRALRIAEGLGATRVVLVEPSAGMRANCPNDVEIWPCGAAVIPHLAEKFDVIVSLWNVLGHIQTAQERRHALSRMKNLIAPGGKIFLDVNHRYNGAAYGWPKTFVRLVHDFVFPSQRNGDVLVSWQVGGRTIRTQGHVFTQAEMRRLFRSSGLRVTRRWVVNYETGAEHRLPFFGQLLYQLTAD
jgi:SAM-dependent methyltransferase